MAMNIDIYDLIVIGAGPGGYISAIRAAQNGMKVLIAEKNRIGGTCLNCGCIPTKAFLYASKLYKSIDSMFSWGIDAVSEKIDIKQLVNNTDAIINNLREGVETLLKQNGVAVIYGEAKIIGAGCVSINGEKYLSENILIAVGAIPQIPDISGVDLPGVFTSDQLLRSTNFYNELLILGGGVIGIEFASIYSSFGSKITIVESRDRLLPQMDEEFSRYLSAIFRKKGIEVITNSQLSSITVNNGKLNYYINGKKELSNADAVLLAVGRKHDTKNLFAANISVAMDSGRIVTDDRFQTSIKGIGDVCNAIQFANYAFAQGIAFADYIAKKNSETDLSVVPWCVFTDPEIASVGLTETSAKHKGHRVKIGRFNMALNGKSLITSEEKGFKKLVFDYDNETLLGAQLMCGNAADIIDEFTLAITNKLTRRDILKNIRPHPSFVEGIFDAIQSINWEGNASKYFNDCHLGECSAAHTDGCEQKGPHKAPF